MKVSENEWRNECIGMSNKEVIEKVIRNPLACPEAKQVARDELLVRLIYEVTSIRNELKQK
jgi:hypothetical protein